MTTDHEEFLNELMGGDHDDHLDELMEQIKYRKAAVQKRAMRGIEPGDRVIVKDDVTPRYLRGQRGKVLSISGAKLVVLFDDGHPESGAEEGYRLDPRQVTRLKAKHADAD